MVKKTSLIILGILLVAFFELSLFFTGKIFLYARSWDSSLDNKKFEKQICCIGDSHTFGVGTIYRYSYPKQLERLLNLNNPETKFNVVNLGIPGNSTKHQVDRLAAFLDKNRVDLVILLTGRNNYFEVKAWEDESFLTDIIIKIQKMRTYKLMKYVLNRLFKIINRVDINGPMEGTKYEEYMRYHLSRAKSLCQRHGCKLLLLSYYSGNYECIERTAKQLGILYFNLQPEFFETILSKDIHNFISGDGSHMNCYGYKIFAEPLYKKMFLYKEALNFRLNPLAKKISKDSLCQDRERSCLLYAQGKSLFYQN